VAFLAVGSDLIVEKVEWNLSACAFLLAEVSISWDSDTRS